MKRSFKNFINLAIIVMYVWYEVGPTTQPRSARSCSITMLVYSTYMENDDNGTCTFQCDCLDSCDSLEITSLRLISSGSLYRHHAKAKLFLSLCCMYACLYITLVCMGQRLCHQLDADDAHMQEHCFNTTSLHKCGWSMRQCTWPPGKTQRY